MASPDTNRNLSNLIRSGTIAEVDLAAAQCRVHTGDLQTDWLPWLVPAAGALIIWAAPTVGEQVVVLSPDGDTMGGVVLRGLYSDAFAPPETAEGVTLVQFGDGAKLRYSDQAHELLAVLPAGGKATITADGGLTINGPVKINGDVTVEGDQRLSGKLTADTDVLGGGVSLKTHKTTGVTPGSGMSGLPQ